MSYLAIWQAKREANIIPNRLIAAVAITVPTVAYLITYGPKRSASHGPKSGVEHEKKQAAISDDSTEELPHEDSNKDESKDKPNPPGGADPHSPGKRSQSGRNVPPPSADNSDLATNWDEKKERKQEFDAQVRNSDFPITAPPLTFLCIFW
jgi:hypothetical protein